MLLAIETAETACSAALIADGAILDERHELVGRGHAERIIPMIGDLLGGRRPDGIVVDCGPGSFTGLRVGIAAARGLGLGWNIPVTGFSATALIAASAFQRFVADELAVAMTGGHGQVFVEGFRRRPFGSLGPLLSLSPDDAAIACKGLSLIVGSGAGALVAAGLPGSDCEPIMPRAADIRLLAEEHRALPPNPIYGRAPDARPPGPRKQ